MISLRAVLFCSWFVLGFTQCYTSTTNSLSFRTCAGTFCNRVAGNEYLGWGTVMMKIGGPTRNGDYDWLNVKLASNQGVSGWVATNWLQQSTCPGSGGTPPPPNTGGDGCGPGSSSAGKPKVLTWFGPKGLPTQPYGRTQFAWDNCAQWYSAAGCMHNGIDIGYGWGQNVPAVCSGWITSSTDSSGQNPMAAGPKSVIQHCGDWLILYGHMSTTSTGFKNAGDIVGLSGGPWGQGGGNYHLHLEIRVKQSSTTYSNRAVNPAPLFNDATGLVDPSEMKCGDSYNQPDVPYGSATKCGSGTGPWCGCVGFCR